MPEQVPVAKLPLPIRRRAVQHLASVSASGMAPAAKAAGLGEVATAYMRPDLGEVAYWELELAGIAGRDEVKNAGFLVMATGDHDFPVSHFSFENVPPSHRLAEAAGGKVTTIYKLDALGYVGEDPDGRLAAQLGDLPPRIVLPEGYDGTAVSTLTAKPADPSRPDRKRQTGEPIVETSGAKPPKVSAKAWVWESWEQLKKEYGKTYAPLLEDLRRRAAESWEIEHLVEEFGEGLRPGRPHRVGLVGSMQSFEAAGDGAKLVGIRKVGRGRYSALELVAQNPVTPGEVELELAISYEGIRSKERLKFFVVPDESPSNTRAARLPSDLELGGGS